jgi:hypothetical protein
MRNYRLGTSGASLKLPPRRPFGHSAAFSTAMSSGSGAAGSLMTTTESHSPVVVHAKSSEK